jgi:PAS domain-containing protein
VASLVQDVSERARAETKLLQSLDQLRATLKAAIDSLASAIEMRDPYTAGHEKKVAQIASAVAVQLGMTSDQLTTILFPTGVTGLDRPATADNIAQLYLAVNNAITAGTITGNASSMTAALLRLRN